MKTKQEINEALNYAKTWYSETTSKYYDAQKQGALDIVFLKDKMIRYEEQIKNLKWVLEDSEPKRTIFDLTEDELKELFDIVCPNYAYEIISVNKGKYVDAIVFTLACPADGFNIYTVSIHSNLSININYGNKPEHVYNQAKYIDRIREMLNKLKEEIK